VRILLVHDGHEFGGLEQLIAASARELGRQHAVGVLVRGPSFGRRQSDERLIAAVRAAGAEVLPMVRGKSKRPLTDVRHHVENVRRIKAFRPDILHIHTVRVDSCANIVVAGRIARVPVVMRTEHNSPTAFSSARAFGSLRGRLIDRLVTAVVTVSEHDRLEQVNVVGRSADKVICIRNGVDPAPFIERRDPAVRAGERALVIGTAGRLAAQKDYRSLIDALARIRAKRDDVHLRIAGQGPLLSELQEHARRLDVADRVHFVGQVEDVPSFLAGLDIGVMSSLHEGLSLVLLEMMAAGLPTVVTDIPGLTEPTVDGRTGLIVPVGDDAALAEALLALIDDPKTREAFGRAARQRVETEFSLAHYFDELRDTHSWLLARARPGRAQGS
jgi:glycosyltransferase involved in cell wall biosynthesis